MIDRIKEKNIVLRIAAIVMLIINGISLVTALLMFAGSADLNAQAAALGIEGVPVSMYLTAIFGALLYVVIGAFGLLARTRKTLLTAGIIVMAVCVVGILYNIVRTGFNIPYLLGIVVPAVFLYGAWKQPEEQAGAVEAVASEAERP